MDWPGYESQYDRIISCEAFDNNGNGLYEPSNVQTLPYKQSPERVPSKGNPEGFPIELIDVNVNEIPVGEVPSDDNIYTALGPTRSSSSDSSNLHEDPIPSKRRTIAEPQIGKLN